MRKFRFLGRAGRLGTGLTALFLLVRCTVTPRDYSLLGIGGNGGTAGAGGSAGNVGGSAGNAGGGAGGSGGAAGAAGQLGMSGMGGMSGQDAGPTIQPVPCSLPDAGSDPGDAGNDAGKAGGDAGDAGKAGSDAGDAGSDTAATCECVGGFFQAVDADGDGVGTRACSIAPGLDCDDGDDTVTHNACGGCTDLPNTVGADCLECGAYACDGPDSVVCASKPDPVEDPDCRCLDGVIAARDTDGDGEGTRLCEANPGQDCNDGDSGYVTNDCGGCETQPAALGSPCNQCGTYACSGTAIVCSPSTGAAGRQCLNTTTRQTCIGNGFWGNNTTCPEACYQGNCEDCLPGTYQCVDLGGGSFQLEECKPDAILGCSSSSCSYGVGWSSIDSCTPAQTCDAVNGQCTGHLLLPRDRSFDLGLPARGGLPWHELLNTASETDYG